MVWTPQPEDRPFDVLHSAVDDTRAERYEDALQKFSWFHEASRSECGMGGVRLSLALGYWIDLASQYPSALAAFKKLRDDVEQRCRDSCGDFEAFHDTPAFNRHLNDDRRTIDLFIDIARDYLRNAKRIYHVAERVLVADGMYQQCAPFLDWERRIEMAISAYRIGLTVPPICARTTQKGFQGCNRTSISRCQLQRDQGRCPLHHDYIRDFRGSSEEGC